jgi:hypothetical protein
MTYVCFLLIFVDVAAGFMMSESGDTSMHQQFQKAFEVVVQHCMQWREAVVTSGKTLDSLLNLSDAYHCALSFDISDSPLSKYTDLDQLTRIKRTFAFSDKLDELLAVVYVHLNMFCC